MDAIASSRKNLMVEIRIQRYHIRDNNISFFARPRRLYDRKTDMELTCPCTSAFLSSSEGSSLYILEDERNSGSYGRKNAHLRQDIPDNSTLMIFSNE